MSMPKGWKTDPLSELLTEGEIHWLFETNNAKELDYDRLKAFIEARSDRLADKGHNATFIAEYLWAWLTGRMDDFLRFCGMVQDDMHGLKAQNAARRQVAPPHRRGYSEVPGVCPGCGRVVFFVVAITPTPSFQVCGSCREKIVYRCYFQEEMDEVLPQLLVAQTTEEIGQMGDYIRSVGEAMDEGDFVGPRQFRYAHTDRTGNVIEPL